MEVHLDCYGPFREAAGRKRLTRELADGATVGDLLRGVAEEHSELAEGLLAEDGSVAPSPTVTVAGTPIARGEAEDTPLSDGDVVRVSPPIKGGTGAACVDR